MKKVILDTNFIMNCVSQKIDFFNDIKLIGIKILIPKQVINELKKIRGSGKRLRFRDSASLSLKILEANKEEYNLIDISKYGKNTDSGIRNYSNSHKDTITATLDRELKKGVSRSKMVIRGKKKLEVI